MRDFQKQKVYNWEGGFITPRFSDKVHDVEFLQNIVNYMWMSTNQVNPPTVYTDNDYKTKSTGNRHDIRLMPHMQTEKTTVHELAHSFSLRENRDAEFDWHGPNFVADYAFFLNRFYNFEAPYLLWSVGRAGVKMNTGKFYNNMKVYGGNSVG